MKKIIISFVTLCVFVFICSCAKQENRADAYGSFEATDITLSSEISGKVVSIPVRKGNRIKKGDLICIIDTTLLNLQKSELETQMAAIKTKLLSISAQISVIDQQYENVTVNYNRVIKMLKQNAATKKQYDDLSGQLRVLEKKREAHTIQKLSVTSEIEVLKQKRHFLNEQMKRCYMYAPVNGTILEKYLEPYEITAAGKPVCRIADLAYMTLTVYVSAGQVNRLMINDSCVVHIDKDRKSSISYPGSIAWISQQAEFTPKIILTKEVRVNLVYAVQIRVRNDGRIKIGMPGETIFSTEVL
jgi:HlyD family secretion protein